ncbi:MAG TPA: hypothetical protein VJT81_10950 [Burkholderiales bacterium]|nr:hypothetical protein [Burkholderiales bacterium]
MSTVIAGRFDSIFQAEVAAESLRRHHFDNEDVCLFACNPSGATGAEPGVNVGSRSGVRGKFTGKRIDNRPAQRRAGVIVAARAKGPADEQTAIQVLQAEGASDIEKAEGKWSSGRWTDFDPVVEPSLIHDRHFNPIASTSAGYQVGDKLLD